MKRLFPAKTDSFLATRRIFSLSAVVLPLLSLGSMLLSSCQPPTVGYQSQGFATLRVMNFAGFCSTPMDIYWDPVGPTPEKQAKIYNLNFGVGAIYATGILTGTTGTTYHIVAKRTGDTSSAILRQRDITLQPGGKYTWILTLPDTTSSSTLIDTLVEDANSSPADPTSHAFVRFINEMPGSPNLSLLVNDPTTGLELTPGPGEGFRQVSPYASLPTGADIGIGYYVVNTQTRAIVARLFNQTPVAGEWYTLVYSGDLCRTPYVHPEDTLTDRQDTLRLRTFDDNTDGNDKTVPVPSSIRFNVINGVVDQPYRYGIFVDDSGHQANQLGFVFNTFTLPKKHNFTFDPVQPLHPGGLKVSTDPADAGVYDVLYQTGDLPATPMDIRIYATDGSTDNNTHELFDYPKGVTSTAKLISDNSYTFIWADTVSPPSKNIPAFRGAFIPVPDASSASTVRLVFIPGIISVKGQNANKYYSNFFYTDPAGGTPIPSALNKTGGGAFGRWDNSVVIQVTPKTSYGLTVTTKIGSSTAQIDGPSQTFQATAGGIYEVALLGKREDPHLMIIRVNP